MTNESSSQLKKAIAAAIVVVVPGLAIDRFLFLTTGTMPWEFTETVIPNLVLSILLGSIFWALFCSGLVAGQLDEPNTKEKRVGLVEFTMVTVLCTITPLLFYFEPSIESAMYLLLCATLIGSACIFSLAMVRYLLNPSPPRTKGNAVVLLTAISCHGSMLIWMITGTLIR